MNIRKPIELNQVQAKLITSMRRALVERREVLDIDGQPFRFCRRGEEFEDGDTVFLARESGVFIKFSAECDGKPAPGRWVYCGSTDDLEELMFRHFLKDKSDSEIEALSISISATSVLREMSRTRSSRAEPSTRHSSPR
ncbi:hypothetical protein [Paucibacter soli]|uniref:hypothetical protein n=1 Tax=Paucibacter soli TaxID=3133433 RepID=UPI0030993FB8